MSKCCGLYESEYQYGLRMEKLLHPIFNNIFNKQFKETDKFCVYDFFKDNIFLELKSRKVSLNTYPTTIVGMYKIKETMKMKKLHPERDYYYFFKFIDNDKKLYYWKFDEKELEEEIGNNTFYIRDVVRRDRPEKKPVPHLNIPCRFLTEIKYTDNI